MSINALPIFIATYLGASTAKYGYTAHTSYNSNAQTPSLDFTVSVNIPFYKEPAHTLQASILSLLNQNIVKAQRNKFEFVAVGTASDTVSDFSIPEKYADVFIVEEEEGKLAARNSAIEESTGKIIVSVDADTYYPPNWMNMMLKPYFGANTNVVATNAPKDFGPLFECVGASLFKTLYYSFLIIGRSSTFYREAYFKTGGFDLSIPCEDIEALQREEEIYFRQKLSKIGKVVDLDVVCKHYFDDYPKFRGIRACNRGKHSRIAQGTVAESIYS
jgi:glycosyltransferase involved in cell wall biosynthesis